MRINTYLAVVAVIVVAAGLAGQVRSVQAQSLGDLARTEEERRKDIKVPAKVITNKDLGVVPGPPIGSVSSAAGTEAAKDSAQAQDDTLAAGLWERSAQLVGLAADTPA